MIVSVAIGTEPAFWASMLVTDTNRAKNKKRNVFIDALPTSVFDSGSGDGKQNAAEACCKKTGKSFGCYCCVSMWLKSFWSGRLSNMAARKPLARNNHLEEAMALLIRNQAAFVEQIARNDQERLKLQLTGDDRQRKIEDWQRETEDWERKIEDWQRNALERFDKIEERLAKIETTLVDLPKTLLQTILDQIPKIRKEIGFTPPT